MDKRDGIRSDYGACAKSISLMIMLELIMINDDNYYKARSFLFVVLLSKGKTIIY